MDKDRKRGLGLSRRDFIKAAGLAAGSAVLAACTPPSVVPAIEAGAFKSDLVNPEARGFIVKPLRLLNTGYPRTASIGPRTFEDLILADGGISKMGVIEYADEATKIAFDLVGRQEALVAVTKQGNIVPGAFLNADAVDPELFRVENVLRYNVDGNVMRAAIFLDPSTGVNFPLDRVNNITAIDTLLAGNGYSREQVQNLRIIQSFAGTNGAKMEFELKMADGKLLYGEGPKNMLSRVDQAIFHPLLRHSDELIFREFSPEDVVQKLFNGEVLTPQDGVYSPILRIKGGNRYQVVLADVVAPDGTPLGAFLAYSNEQYKNTGARLVTGYSINRSTANLTGVVDPMQSYTRAVVSVDALAQKMASMPGGSEINIRGKVISADEWLSKSMLQKLDMLIDSGATAKPLPESARANTVLTKYGGEILSVGVTGLISTRWAEVVDLWKFGDTPDFMAVLNRVGASLISIATAPSIEALTYPYRTGFFNLDEMSSDINTLLVISPENPSAAQYLNEVGPRLFASKQIGPDGNPQLILLPVDPTVEIDLINNGEETEQKSSVDQLAPVGVETTYVDVLPTHEEFDLIVKQINDNNPKNPELSLPTNWKVYRVTEDYYVGQDDKRYERFDPSMKSVYVNDSIYVVVFQDTAGNRKVYAADVFHVEDANLVS